MQLRDRASYDGLRGFSEGKAIVAFGEAVVDCKIFYSNPGFAKAMRVTRFMALPPPDEEVLKHATSITKLRDMLVNKTWTAERADVAVATPLEIKALGEGFRINRKAETNPVDLGIAAIVQVHALTGSIDVPADAAAPADTGPTATKPQMATPPASQQPAAPASPFSAKPQDPPPLSSPPPAAAQPAQNTGGGPMGFFKAPGSSPETPPPAPVQKQEEQAPPPVKATPVPPATPQQPAKPKLPKELQDIIDAAAKASRKELFKDETKSEKDESGIDAAE